MNKWITKYLKDLCDEIADIDHNMPKAVSKGIPFISAKDITEDNKIDFTNTKFISESDFNRLARKITPKIGDIIYSRIGTIGKAAIVKDNIIFLPSYSCCTIRPNKEFINTNYLLFYLKSHFAVNQAKHGANGVGVPDLGMKVIKHFEIPIPSLLEQKRIASILDKAFSAIDKAKANAEQNLKNAKELFESYLNNIFENKGDDWEEKTLKEIGITQTGTTPKTIEKENYGKYIPFIKPADVNFNGIGDLRYNNEGLSKIGLKNGRLINKQSILMVCIGATIGKVGFSVQEVSCNQQINSLTVKKDMEPKFIYYAMTSKIFQEKVLKEGKGAQATLPIINKTKWENLSISYPKSKIKQKDYVDKFDSLINKTKSLEQLYYKKLNELESLKKSILQKAFSGEL